MGTDIHLQVERYDENTEEWIDINKQALSYRGTLNHLYEKPKEGEDKPQLSQEEVQDMIFDYWDNNPESRCYMLFSFLADVRNGYGFAGSETYTPIKPIADLRGHPSKSAFSDVFDESEEWCHSPTFFSMKELLEDKGWEQDVENSGYVAFDEWKEFVESQEGDTPMKSPNSYCAGISGGGVVKHPMSEFEKVCASPDKHGDTNDIYIRGKWTEKSPLKDTAFWGWLNSEKMTKLAEQYGSDNIRINIYFDN